MTEDVPSELDFLEALGVEPIESIPTEGYWCYRVPWSGSSMLRLSFRTHERSIQTAIEDGGRDQIVVVHEGLEELKIHDHSRLSATIDLAGRCPGRLDICLDPPRLEWTFLRAR